jgi:hypothetical protein
MVRIFQNRHYAAAMMANSTAPQTMNIHSNCRQQGLGLAEQHRLRLRPALFHTKMLLSYSDLHHL